jgi:hypothetical protein
MERKAARHRGNSDEETMTADPEAHGTFFVLGNDALTWSVLTSNLDRRQRSSFYIPRRVIGDTCICPYRCSLLITCCSAFAKAYEPKPGADSTTGIRRSSELLWTI